MIKCCVVVDNPLSWFLPHAKQLVERLCRFGDSLLISNAAEISHGNEVAFILSCEKKLSGEFLSRSRHNIVVHASDLPQGKGMSPLAWQILEGKDVIPITLFEAVEAIDAGPIYMKDSINFKGIELLGEMQKVLGEKIVEMCLKFMSEYPEIVARGRPQIGSETRYARRRPDDSRLDVTKSIADQFNLLRIADNVRYPAFFEYKGRKYILNITAQP